VATYVHVIGCCRSCTPSSGAAAQLRRERHECTLQPTALVHEAYLRLVDQQRAAWCNRAQFFAIASQMMRRLLIDRERVRRTAKRAGGRV
jgi:hypothetical protein